MGWLKDALTGADNETVAIGRLIGLAVTVVLLIALPTFAAFTIYEDRIPVTTWTAFMAALEVYVPAICVAVAGLVWGTNSTEPKPGHDTDHN